MASTQTTTTVTSHASPILPLNHMHLQEHPQHESISPMFVEDGNFTMEPTDVTIKTNIDPHKETTTTITIVHLPFQVSRQCQPPKVISWMKSDKPKRPTPVSTHQSGRHRSQSSPAKLQHIFPFLSKRRRKTDAAIKKGDRAVTLFSIQVTVLGKVVVSPTSPTTSSSPAESKMENDIEPTKTVPACLNKAETTSYVIHRTFEDFERLSETVLRLEHKLQTHHHYHHLHSHHQKDEVSESENAGLIEAAPSLTALHVHHPHPGLYQMLLKQISNVKANQRAFDASSTTHGFDEEGAFERILELNEYLEKVWYWLLPENTPPQLDLSIEQQEIMQWLKPLPQSVHQDGRQMRERSEQEKKKEQPQILLPQGSMSSMRKKKSQEQELSKKREAKQSQLSVISDDLRHVESSSERPSSISSRSSRSSTSSSSSASSATSASISPAILKIDQGSTHDLDLHDSTFTSSPTALSPSGSESDSNKGKMASDYGSIKVAEGEEPSLEEHSAPATMAKRGNLYQRRRDNSDPLSSIKLNRRISLSNVVRSLTSPLNHRHQSSRQPMFELTRSYKNGRFSPSASASEPTSPTRKSSFKDEIIIWNMVTTKNHPTH
ncbi:hypothetical protein BX616_003408 [Lobosporangium transversale]|uniref:PX domain-containing protein n=1 Tax=Lobosporangium transversale TaxID=64571 RepID=A0A1Y2H2W0_9FUNG|nr:hypothetical protein BCR41DRAFT_345119 [Lobosporangium transversale]KAF9898966.1 hypothetical protein BX616_003408 [Lobosporangium transversale]ORZ28321.1 hypothetical protein BCR41DRAFT_345119 [Lobosporangium transversale]|eukprot:XP_021886006.1 hypothetical protein BCR41DRAFT_345119 [Lobosporangium transversale]